MTEVYGALCLLGSETAHEKGADSRMEVDGIDLVPLKFK